MAGKEVISGHLGCLYCQVKSPVQSILSQSVRPGQWVVLIGQPWLIWSLHQLCGWSQLCQSTGMTVKEVWIPKENQKTRCDQKVAM